MDKEKLFLFHLEQIPKNIKIAPAPKSEPLPPLLSPTPYHPSLPLLPLHPYCRRPPLTMLPPPLTITLLPVMGPVPFPKTFSNLSKLFLSWCTFISGVCIICMFWCELQNSSIHADYCSTNIVTLVEGTMNYMKVIFNELSNTF